VTDPIRVVVWSTGGVGSVAVDGIRHRPDLKLVGVWVHSPDKVGKDVGELVGGGVAVDDGCGRFQPQRFLDRADGG